MFKVLFHRLFIGSAVFIISLFTLQGQSSYLDYNHRAYNYIDRISHLNSDFYYPHASVRKIKYEELSRYLHQLDTLTLSDRDLFDKHYYQRETNDSTFELTKSKGLFNTFYQNPAYLYSLETKDFQVNVNAFMDFSVAQESEEDKFLFLNKRGIEIWGALDQKFYFYSSIHENQGNFPNYINNFIDKYMAIPGQGHYKPYQSSLINAFNGYDFANARAYVGYQTSKHTHIELGHGNHFFGNGIRSLLQSNFSHNYFYLSFNVNVWKLHYQSIVSELSPISSRQTIGNTVLPKKYMATHYLSYAPSQKFEIGLFESVVFSRENQFEFQYLNPVILYRTVEALFDSPDNVLLGLNLNWRPLKKTSLYSQILVDELKTSEIFSGDGWWGNKWAFQFGLKHFDLLNIKTLDLNIELNRVRPFTYSHNSSVQNFNTFALSNYSHFNQSLAHPLGANFNEVILKLNYRPINRLFISGQYLYTKVGRNIMDTNFGNDILLNNDSRSADFGVAMFQGSQSNIFSLDLQMSFCLTHDLFIDIFYRNREERNDDLGNIKTNISGIGIRYNIEKNSIDY